MSDKDDPERLLAEALRAQAVRAPADTSPVGYGLLSGDDALPVAAPSEDSTVRISGPAKVSASLVLLLALLLGLASGAVVGLLTLL